MHATRPPPSIPKEPLLKGIPSPKQFAARSLQALDGLALECDGLSRSLSMLLQRDDIEHTLCVGELVVDGVGRIALHWWVELPDGVVCDARARMWLGSDARVPHGVFRPESTQHYRLRETLEMVCTPTIFWILTGKPLEAFPSIQASDRMVGPTGARSGTIQRGAA